jgi:hypothetical protein
MNIKAIDTRGFWKVNKDYKVSRVKVDGAEIIIIDDFLVNPERVRDFILDAPAPMWKHKEGGYNFKKYYDCRNSIALHHREFFEIEGAIRKEAGKAVYFAKTPNYCRDDVVITNIFQNIKGNPHDGIPIPHEDGRIQGGLLYLNHDDEVQFKTGTAFYKSKFNGIANTNKLGKLEKRAVDDFTLNSGIEEDGYDYYLHDWKKFWEPAGFIQSKFNRLLMWPGDIYHGAYHGSEDFVDYPRVNQCFFLEDDSKRRYDDY